MALTSPGVEVTVIDESQYTSGGTGTVPLIILATEENKLIPGSTTIASGTTKAQANQLYLLTSQQEVISTFGQPQFETDDTNTVIQGGELNEYGLWTGFNYLGAMDRAYIVRADIDLASLKVQNSEPVGPVSDGTKWFDLDESDFGLFRANGNSANSLAWDKVEPSFIGTTLPVVGTIGDIAVIHEGTQKQFELHEFTASGWNIPSTNNDAIAINSVSTTGFNFTSANAFTVTIDGVDGTPIVDASLTALSAALAGSHASITTSITGAVLEVSIAASTVDISIEQTTVVTGELFEINVSNVVKTLVFNTQFPSGTTVGDLLVKTAPANQGFQSSMSQYSALNDLWVDTFSAIGSDFVDLEGVLSGSVPVGTTGFTHHAVNAAFTPNNYTTSAPTVSTGTPGASPVAGTVTIKSITSSGKIGTFTVALTGTYSLADAVIAINNTANSEGFNIVSYATATTITVEQSDGMSMVIDNGTTVLNIPSSSNWAVSTSLFEYDNDEPVSVAVDGTLWYDDGTYADVLVNTGTAWVGLRHASGITAISNVYGSSGNNCEVQFSVIAPQTKSTNITLEVGDIWVNTTDMANLEYYINIDASSTGWNLLDKSDQSSVGGLLFGAIRKIDLSGTEIDIESRIEVASTQSVTFDGVMPDPATYPAGMFAVNVNVCGGVVREFDATASSLQFGNGTVAAPTTAATSTGEWNLYSGLDLDGSLRTNWKAQRQPVVEALASTIVGTTELRAETIDFTLLLTPGYFECYDEMVNLTIDRSETSYIITDVPARLTPDATTVSAWANNTNNAASNGPDGRITKYAYSAQYFGWGLGSNIDGSEVAIPPSSVALRTYAYNDSVSYVWYPPAGYTRGLVSNATSTGYINSEGDYTPAILDQGQRDVMIENGINPITFRPGRGLVVFGDMSLSPTSSALDRVNVGRLMVKIRKDIAETMEKYLFELNISRTRGSAQGEISSYLSQILEKDGLYDFTVICDESNNTSARIDANELWMDIYVQPTKSINFIYVPIRIQNTGE